MRKTVISMIVAAAVGGSSLALAAAGGPGMGQSHGEHGGMMAMQHGMDMHDYAQLDLSDAQHASIKQIMQQSHAQTKPQMKSLQQQHEALEAMDPTSSGYQAAANSFAQAAAEATRAHVLEAATLRARIYGILTPAQRSQLATMRAQHQAREQQWKEFQAQHPLPSSGSSAQ